MDLPVGSVWTKSYFVCVCVCSENAEVFHWRHWWWLDTESSSVGHNRCGGMHCYGATVAKECQIFLVIIFKICMSV